MLFKARPKSFAIVCLYCRKEDGFTSYLIKDGMIGILLKKFHQSHHHMVFIDGKIGLIYHDTADFINAVD